MYLEISAGLPSLNLKLILLRDTHYYMHANLTTNYSLRAITGCTVLTGPLFAHVSAPDFYYFFTLP